MVPKKNIANNRNAIMGDVIIFTKLLNSSLIVNKYTKSICIPPNTDYTLSSENCDSQVKFCRQKRAVHYMHCSKIYHLSEGRVILFEFTLTRSFRFFLTSYTRFFVVLSFTSFLKRTAFRNCTFETT